MKAYRIKYQSHVFEVILEESPIIMVTQRYGKYYLKVYAMRQEESTFEVVYWIDLPMSLGENLEIDVVDVYESSETMKRKTPFENEEILTEREHDEMIAETLESYYELKKLLKKEGLIQ